MRIDEYKRLLEREEKSRASKYRNIPVQLEGHVFASRKEAKRYAELRVMERAGQITDLECHPRFPLTVNGVSLGTAILDFGYVDASGRLRLEDVKGGSVLPLSRLKARLVKALYNVEVEIVR